MLLHNKIKHLILFYGFSGLASTLVARCSSSRRDTKVWWTEGITLLKLTGPQCLVSSTRGVPLLGLPVVCSSKNEREDSRLQKI